VAEAVVEAAPVAPQLAAAPAKAETLELQAPEEDLLIAALDDSDAAEPAPESKE
jgi:hypothetical protein